MSEQRFDGLRIGLMRAGVAARCARREVRDLETRFASLVAGLQAQGETLDHARARADQALGTNQSLISHFASRTDLRAWPCRWPGLIFTLVPPLLFVAIVATAIVALGTVSDWVVRSLPDTEMTPEIVKGAGAMARIVVLWCVPVVVSGYFAYLAYRHRMAIRWPILAVGLVCASAAFMNFDFTFNQQLRSGSVGAGFYASAATLPSQLVHLLIMAVIVLGPLLVALRIAARTR